MNQSAVCLFVTWLSILLTECSAPTTSHHEPTVGKSKERVEADTVAHRYQVLGADCGLFPAAARLLTDEEGHAPFSTGRFSPTIAQVTRIEHDLRTLPLQRVSISRDHYIKRSYLAFIYAHLADYKRQYFGFYNVQHHPCLYVHFIGERIRDYPGQLPHWLREAYQVDDGGASFWAIKYDWTTHQFYDFEHNSDG